MSSDTSDYEFRVERQWRVLPPKENQIFIKGNADNTDESAMRSALVSHAKTRELAKQEVLNLILSGEYRIIEDKLWAWR